MCMGVISVTGDMNVSRNIWNVFPYQSESDCVLAKSRYSAGGYCLFNISSVIPVIVTLEQVTLII